MSVLDPFEDHPLLRPFSFDGWDDEGLSAAPIAFAAKWIDEYTSSAEVCEKLGLVERAVQQRERAAWWTNLTHLSKDEGNELEFAVRSDATEHIDVLLERATISEDATRHLMVLAEHIFTGLSQLAMHDNEQAAKSLVNSLCYIVDGFNDLAWKKPEAFLHATRRNQGMPGIITRFSEKTKGNEQLVERLQVGVDYVHQLPTAKDGKKGNKASIFDTPANLWADRLYMHIYHAKIALELFEKQGIKPSAHHPVWWQEAIKLPPFSPGTWEPWFEVAWQVTMKATDEKPETESKLSPIGISAAQTRPKYCKTLQPLTQSANVRAKIKGRIKDAFKGTLARKATTNAKARRN